jgi:hypothetical protein
MAIAPEAHIVLSDDPPHLAMTLNLSVWWLCNYATS